MNVLFQQEALLNSAIKKSKPFFTDEHMAGSNTDNMSLTLLCVLCSHVCLFVEAKSVLAETW